SLAEIGTIHLVTIVTTLANLCVFLRFWVLSVSAYSFGRHNSRGNRNHTITDDHHDGCEKFPESRYRRNITISDCSQSYHRPINTCGNARKSRFGITAFYHIHNRTNHHHNQCDKGKKNDDFGATVSQCNQNYISASHKIRQAKNPENPEQSQNSDA